MEPRLYVWLVRLCGNSCGDPSLGLLSYSRGWTVEIVRVEHSFHCMNTNGRRTGDIGETITRENVRHVHQVRSGHFGCDSRGQYNDERSSCKHECANTDGEQRKNGKAFLIYIQNQRLKYRKDERTTVRAAPQISKPWGPTRGMPDYSTVSIRNNWRGWK